MLRVDASNFARMKRDQQILLGEETPSDQQGTQRINNEETYLRFNEALNRRSWYKIAYITLLHVIFLGLCLNLIKKHTTHQTCLPQAYVCT